MATFDATSMDEIPRLRNTVRQTFESNKSKDIEWRLVQLRRLYWGLTEHSDMLAEGLHRDIAKSGFESLVSEIDWCRDDCMSKINNLQKYAKDEKLTDVPWTFAAANSRIRKEPLGAVLIIGTYSFPLQLVISLSILISNSMYIRNLVVNRPSRSSDGLEPQTSLILHNE